MEMSAVLTSLMLERGKYTLLSSVKIQGLDTNWRHLGNSTRFFCKRLKAKNSLEIILYTIPLGVGGSTYTSHTLNHIEELSLDTQKAR